MFSVIVYQITISEVQHRLMSYDTQMQGFRPAPPSKKMLSDIRTKELSKARTSLIIILFYTNLTVIITGGFGAYFLARHTLKPIEATHEQQARFTSDASHELRTPLAAMTTELEVALRDSKLTKTEMRELLESNLEEVQRLTKLSSILLALSAGSATSLERTSFDLALCTRILAERYDTSGSRISITSPTGPLTVIAHQPSIEELITILIDNALKYSPDDSVISIRLSKHKKAIFQIANAGEGIQAEHLPKIFDRFYRTDSARTGNKGYGLGLALARQISDLHRAELTVTSAPKHTTEFTFSLPILSESKD